MNTRAQPQVIGVGIGLANFSGAVTIVYVVPDMPASRAGLSPGFIVQKIDDAVTKGMEQKDWHQRLRGDAGASVRLEVTDPASNQTRVVELVRERIVLPAVLPTSAVLRT